MAGPIIRVSVANKADSSKRFDLVTLWTESDSRFHSQLRASVADATSDGSEQYPEMMITDWLRALAGGDRFHINVRVDKARLLAWLQSAPIDAADNNHASSAAQNDAPF